MIVSRSCTSLYFNDCHQKTERNDITTNLLKIFTTSQLDISSIIISLHPCTESTLSTQMLKLAAFPGANFNISLRSSSNLFNFTPPVFISGSLCNNGLQPGSIADYVCEQDYNSELQSRAAGKQIVTQICNNLTFSVHNHYRLVYLKISVVDLKHDSPSLKIREKNIFVIAEVHLLPCPIGYELANNSNKKPICECIEYLSQQGITCDINQGEKVLRPSKMWLGLHYDQVTKVAIHRHCPFDFCEDKAKYINLQKSEEQCNYNRSNVLCGACQANLSLVLGTSNCKKCSNFFLLLIPPFAVVGIALVVLLLKCNLTVSTGHLNGIIFYANIVHVNKSLLFQSRLSVYEVLGTFIAWLNLDLGIETCFFEGMDTYSKVWLQFVFPVYLWVMIGFIVVLAHYSTRAGRLIGSNSVPVLATLFVLSYAKLLRTIIAAVSFTFIEFEDGSYITVWLHDANVRYLSPKHSALFLVAMLFTLGYIIPLTLLFLLSPCLQTQSHKRAFKWVNHIKPFLDANQGPYSAKFRWWSGLLLIGACMFPPINFQQY